MQSSKISGILITKNYQVLITAEEKYVQHTDFYRRKAVTINRGVE
jgi:hypothetical protein